MNDNCVSSVSQYITWILEADSFQQSQKQFYQQAFPPQVQQVRFEYPEKSKIKILWREESGNKFKKKYVSCVIINANKNKISQT